MKAVLIICLLGLVAARQPALDRYLSSTKKSALDAPDCECQNGNKNEVLSRERNVATWQPDTSRVFPHGLPKARSEADPLNYLVLLKKDARSNPLGPCGCNGGVSSGGSSSSAGQATPFSASKSTTENQCVMKCTSESQHCEACCDGSPVYSNCKVSLGAGACKNDCSFAMDSCESNCAQWGF